MSAGGQEFVMRIKTDAIRYAWLMIILGFFSSFLNAQTGSDSLTQADIEKIVAVQETADALMDEALTQLAKSRAGKDEISFEVMAQIQRIGQDADEAACRKHAVDVGEYCRKLRRIVNVRDFVELETLKNEMQAQLKKRQSLSEAEIRAEAEQQYALTEEWFRGINARTESNVTANTDKPAIPDGYTDSLQKIVMEPIRRQQATGEFVKVAQQANVKRMEEIRDQLRRIDEQMATLSMYQAAADKLAVLEVLDQEILRGLHTSIIEDVPIIPAKEKREEKGS